jgi:hypothetical protein
VKSVSPSKNNGMYIYVYVCMYVCMYVCAQSVSPRRPRAVSVYTHMLTFMHNIHTYMHIHVHRGQEWFLWHCAEQIALCEAKSGFYGIVQSRSPSVRLRVVSMALCRADRPL